MKKKIIITVLTVLLLSILSVTAFAFTTGDVTGDGKLSAADARRALRYSAKLETLSEEHIKAADVDNSGKVTASDARKILRVCAKLDPPFEGINIDEYLIEKGVLHVAVPKDNKPFAYEENGKLKGIDVTMMQEFADRMNLELKLHPMTYEECLDAVKNGSCDMAMSYNYNGVYDGFAAPVSYYDKTLNVVKLKSSSFSSVEQIKGNVSLKIGVLDKTIDRFIVEKINDKSQIRAFATCKDAVVALEKGSIDVFVTSLEYAVNTANINTSVERMNDDSYYSYNHSVVVKEEKAEMLEKIGKYIYVQRVSDYENIDDTMKISVSQDNITIANGGTACIEIFADSFYSYKPSVYASSDNYDCKTILKVINNRYFLFIFAPSNITGYQQVTLNSSTEFIEEYIIMVNVDVDGSHNYQYFDNTKIPDFGAYTGTAPMQTEIDTDNNVIVHTYDAGELYNNGITDSSQIDAYLDKIEAAGYAYMGYQEMGNTVSLVFGNEKTEKYVTYVEVYDEEGYLVAIGIGYEIPDFMF